VADTVECTCQHVAAYRHSRSTDGSDCKPAYVTPIAAASPINTRAMTASAMIASSLGVLTLDSITPTNPQSAYDATFTSVSRSSYGCCPTSASQRCRQNAGAGVAYNWV
jgi:hypothetical protein